MNELFFLIIPNITATLIIRKLHLQPSIINLPRCKKNATIIYRTPSSEKEQSSWKIEWFSIWRPCAAKNEDLKINAVYPRVRRPVSSLTASLSFFVLPSVLGMRSDPAEISRRTRTGICLAHSAARAADKHDRSRVAELSIIGPPVFRDSWPHENLLTINLFVRIWINTRNCLNRK